MLSLPYHLALVGYEHLITIAREVSCIWSRKFTGATVLFALNRYLLLLYVIVQNLPTTSTKVSLVHHVILQLDDQLRS